MTAAPDDAQDRQRRRRERAAKLKAERVRATELNLAHRDIPLSPQVKALLTKGAAKRREAAVAKSRAKRLELIGQARDYEMSAEREHRRQIDERWAAIANGETAKLASDRGVADELPEETTTTHEWVRGKHGEIVRSEDGLPVLAHVKGKVRRRGTGLDLARRKGAIDEAAHQTGLWYAGLCADAAKASFPGREEGSLGGSSVRQPSAGPAVWKLAAERAKAIADAVVIDGYRDPVLGRATVRLLEAVCFEGASLRALGQDDPIRTAKLEERLATGLAMLRQWRIAHPDRPSNLREKAKLIMATRRVIGEALSRP